MRGPCPASRGKSDGVRRSSGASGFGVGSRCHRHQGPVLSRYLFLWREPPVPDFAAACAVFDFAVRDGNVSGRPGHGRRILNRQGLYRSLILTANRHPGTGAESAYLALESPLPEACLPNQVPRGGPFPGGGEGLEHHPVPVVQGGGLSGPRNPPRLALFPQGPGLRDGHVVGAPLRPMPSAVYPVPASPSGGFA